MNVVRSSHRYGMLVVGVAIGAVLAFGVDRLVSAQQGGIRRTILHTFDAPGSATHEAIMGIAELEPGATSGRHRHLGIEMGYVLEGSAVFEHDGRPQAVLKAGDTFRNDGIHNVINKSQAPVKILAVYLVEKGKPLAESVP
jgi:quercetin dioxygenase-like cupin family protein